MRPEPYPLDRRIVWVPLWQGWFIRYPGYWDGAFATDQYSLSPAAAYLWWLSLNGFHDEEWGSLAEGDPLWICSTPIDEHLKQLFPDLTGTTLYVGQDDHGFLHELSEQQAQENINYIEERMDQDAE